MGSQDSSDFQIVNQHTFDRVGEDVTKFRLNSYHKIARHVWAIVMLIAQIHTGVKPNWKKN